MMRTSMNLDFLDRVPVKPPKERCVLALDVGEEAPAAACMRRRHREADERRAERADSAIVRSDGEARSPPCSGLALVDADSANHFMGNDAKRRDGHDGDRDFVDLVAVVVGKDALLDTEHLAPERCRFT